AGTPQGGVISPLLANIYLHTVLDVWFEKEVRPRLRGRAYLTRYADDAVMLFEYEEDARRVMDVLPKRFERYGLALHPDKTRLVPFKRPDRSGRNDDDPRGGSAARTFDFLGFTIHWGQSLKGNWVVRTRTAKDRFRRTLENIEQWCKLHRHAPPARRPQRLKTQHRGHYGYSRRIGNAGRLWDLLYRVVRIWWRWLSRRSQRARLTWPTMSRLLQRYRWPRRLFNGARSEPMTRGAGCGNSARPDLPGGRPESPHREVERVVPTGTALCASAAHLALVLSERHWLRLPSNSTTRSPRREARESRGRHRGPGRRARSRRPPARPRRPAQCRRRAEGRRSRRRGRCTRSAGSRWSCARRRQGTGRRPGCCCIRWDRRTAARGRCRSRPSP